MHDQMRDELDKLNAVVSLTVVVVLTSQLLLIF